MNLKSFQKARLRVKGIDNSAVQKIDGRVSALLIGKKFWFVGYLIQGKHVVNESLWEEAGSRNLWTISKMQAEADNLSQWFHKITLLFFPSIFLSMMIGTKFSCEKMPNLLILMYNTRGRGGSPSLSPSFKIDEGDRVPLVNEGDAISRAGFEIFFCI